MRNDLLLQMCIIKVVLGGTGIQYNMTNSDTKFTPSSMIITGSQYLRTSEQITSMGTRHMKAALSTSTTLLTGNQLSFWANATIIDTMNPNIQLKINPTTYFAGWYGNTLCFISSSMLFG